MRAGGIVALSGLAVLALAPSSAVTAAPGISAARCAAAELTAYTQKPAPEQTGDDYERIQTWRSLALDEPNGTGRFMKASAAFILDPTSAQPDAERCRAIDPLSLTPPMPENPKGDYKACDRRERQAQEIALTALKDFQNDHDGGAFCRKIAEAEALLMAQRAEMAGGKSTCDMPQYAWIEAGDKVMTYRMLAAATAEATGKSCDDFEGKRSASL
ncbi:MAG: hypothetical protein K0R83_838 [Caulobacter sp.]|jgi:hypothetical protein|nr:hypothetical protein [Caulobacter sp.]